MASSTRRAVWRARFAGEETTASGRKPCSFSQRPTAGRRPFPARRAAGRSRPLSASRRTSRGGGGRVRGRGWGGPGLASGSAPAPNIRDPQPLGAPGTGVARAGEGPCRPARPRDTMTPIRGRPDAGPLPSPPGVAPRREDALPAPRGPPRAPGESLGAASEAGERALVAVGRAPEAIYAGPVPTFEDLLALWLLRRAEPPPARAVPALASYARLSRRGVWSEARLPTAARTRSWTRSGAASRTSPTRPGRRPSSPGPDALFEHLSRRSRPGRT